MGKYQFCVDERPFCVFEQELEKVNAEYLESINSQYYHFNSALYEKVLNDKDSNKEAKQFAAMSLRINYAHALETLFALIFAMLQSPSFVLGWMLRYRNKELGNLVLKVNSGTPIKTKFYKIHNISWESIVRLIFKNYSKEEIISKEKIIDNFTKLLASLASDFLNTNLKMEYNSTKHGFRAKPGGGGLRMKLNKPGAEWNDFIKGDYGSFYYTYDNIGESKNHFILSHNKMIWDPKDLFYGINFAGLLLHNVASFLKGFNKITMKNPQYKYLLNEKDYNLPWENKIGSGHIRLGTSIDKESIEFYSDEEILSSYIKK